MYIKLLFVNEACDARVLDCRRWQWPARQVKIACPRAKSSPNPSPNPTQPKPIPKCLASSGGDHKRDVWYGSGSHSLWCFPGRGPHQLKPCIPQFPETLRVGATMMDTHRTKPSCARRSRKQRTAYIPKKSSSTPKFGSLILCLVKTWKHNRDQSCGGAKNTKNNNLFLTCSLNLFLGRFCCKTRVRTAVLTTCS